MTVGSRKPKRPGVKARKVNPVKLLPDAPVTPPQALMPKPPYVGRLATVADWHRQVGKIFREMRKGLLPTEIGTRLTYVARTGSELAKFVDEAQQLAALKEQLSAIRGTVSTEALSFDQHSIEDGLEVAVQPPELPIGREPDS